MSAEIKTLHEPFATWLRREKIPFIRGRSDKKSRITLGAHDFTVFLGSHRCLCIEFKDKDGALSPDQKAWISQMEAVGGTVYVIRQLHKAVELVQQWRANLPPLSSPAPEPKNPVAANSCALRLMQWCGQTWTVTQDGTRGRNGWSLLHKATTEELATLQKV